MMRYYVYSTFGNQVELDSMLSLWEIDNSLNFTRSIEINADGRVLKYSEDHQADEHGQLPEGEWDEDEAPKPEYGPVIEIGAAVFETAWKNMLAYNMSR